MSLLLLSVVTPLHIDSSPCESGAKGRKDKVIAFLQLFLEIPSKSQIQSGKVPALLFP